MDEQNYDSQDRASIAALRGKNELECGPVFNLTVTRVEQSWPWQKRNQTPRCHRAKYIDSSVYLPHRVPRGTDILVYLQIDLLF